MLKFLIEPNDFLRQEIQAFYHTDYIGFRKPNNPDYINILKNTYGNEQAFILKNSVQELREVLLADLPRIIQILQLNSLMVCVVPRAKTDYQPNQLLLKSTIRGVVNQLNGYNDGIGYIARHTNTKTTHLSPTLPNYNNDGAKPYPGITIRTCNISNDVRGKNILLIDDLYTKTVNIDEDAIQALLTNGANSVTFYAIGRTKYRGINK
jgi:hypothetical protein